MNALNERAVYIPIEEEEKEEKEEMEDKEEKRGGKGGKGKVVVMS